MSGVLVTGAAGFIGRHLLERLGALAWPVTGVSRTGDGGLGVRAVDLADAAACEALLHDTRPDVVIHLASVVTGSRAVEAVAPTLSANLVSTVHLLTAAWRSGVRRVVLAGSMEEPGSSPPHSPYAASKAAAALYGSLFRNLYGLEVVHLRIHMVYGPGQRDLSKLVPSVIASALAGRPPEVASGRRRVDWIYVADVVDAIVAAATVDPAPGVTVDVGTGTLHSVREVVEQIVRAVDPSLAIAFGAVADRPHEVEPVADVDAAASMLGGWRAAVPLEEGLRRTVAAARAGRGAEPELRGPLGPQAPG